MSWKYIQKAQQEIIGININGEYLNHLRFEDIVLISETAEEFKEILTDLNRENLKADLRINKIKVMFNFLTQSSVVTSQDETFKEVDEYKYLGQEPRMKYRSWNRRKKKSVWDEKHLVSIDISWEVPFQNS